MRSSAYIRSSSEEQRFDLMPVRCRLIMFFVAQSMAVNRNDNMIHPGRTPDFTVNLAVEFPKLEELDEFHQLFWNSIVPQDFAGS